MLNGIQTSDRPRERLVRIGAKALTTVELLALLINHGTSGSSAIDIAMDLLEKFPKLTDLAGRDVSELKRIHGMGTAKAATLCAAFELANRIQGEPFDSGKIIGSPHNVYKMMSPKLRHLRFESFHVLLLNTANQIVRDIIVSEGSLNSVTIHPREVFRMAITENAAAIILVHNHPSGNTEPSPQDISITKQIADAGIVVGIKVLDHLIIGGDYYTSLAERNIL
ncbi:MAG: DNA repair protein RadC [Ignavibacteria bacterium]|nr:DNA repair protein RadC [Ignavibacteria bacterium]